MKTYDPALVAVIVGGRQISGFADGTFVTVERDADAWELKIGTDGEGTRSKSNNKSGTIKITLMQSSDSNATLQGFATSDELSNSGAFPLLVKDASGTSIHSAETAWIQKEPQAEYGREVGNREWTIRTDNLKNFHGGN